MVANWVKAVWILIGGTVAAAGAAYVGGVFEPSRGGPAMEAAIQQPPAAQKGQGKEAAETAAAGSAAPAGEDEAEEDQQVAALPPAAEQAGQQEQPAPAADATLQTPQEPEITVPAFDLVRVEPDGSVVIAGTAAANSTVEVIAGATVIGTAEAGPTGDFAVVLDNPLKPGDYTLVLRATLSDSLVATSAQTAVIAVPETENDQVLALVEEPGAPSRLITVPNASEPKDEASAAERAPEQRIETAAEPPAAAPAVETKPEPAVAASEPVADAEPSGESRLAGDAAAGDEPAPAGEQQRMAALEQPDPAPAAPTPTAKPQAAPRVAVEAVEIEGRNVFVAGYAEAGTTVRVYANDILLGQAVASEAGRFLIETERDLPVGDYIVRADMLSADKSEVVARAAVPFEREPGENLAAVAAPRPAEPAEPAVQQPAAEATAGEMAVAQADGPAASTEAGSGRQVASADTDTGSGRQVASTDTDTGSAAPAAGSASREVAALGSDTATDAAGVGAAAPDAPAAAEPLEATAPKLQNVGSAVIIRRGDTLWRLSRRVYGRGVRYTTIYLANQDQIADPDMIWPGQVFAVPSETDEGEAADMSAISEQVAEPGENSGDVATR